MSSTNHTTNYNLPQFLGTDKPAWLGDINPAMSAIDTAMKANATTAAQGVSDASTAKNRADDAYTKAGDAETAAGAAQGTANQAIANSNTNAGKILALEAQFNLNDIERITTLPSTGGWSNSCDITLAQNAAGSVFKLYGLYAPVNNTAGTVTITKTAIPGKSGWYGIATGLYLNDTPDSAYSIAPTGIAFPAGIADYIGGDYFFISSLAVGTDGQVYLNGNELQTETIPANQRRQFQYMPCIYFNKNFGDQE